MASIWQLTAIVYLHRTVLFGVVLDGDTTTSKGTSSSLKSGLAIASSYFRTTCARASLKVKWGKLVLSTQTDDRGGFYLETTEPFDHGDRLELWVEGQPVTCHDHVLRVHFIRETGDLVISDIDDTVLVSHTGKKFKRLFTTLFRSYVKRKPVQETSRIFDLLGRTQNDHVYVSRSEYNLYPLLSNFFAHQDLPEGPLLLTPFLNFKSLLRGKKDPDFKIKTIQSILEHSGHQKVVLIGDDTQHDLQIYAEIAKTRGSRIKKVYIRQTDTRVDKRHSPDWSELSDFVENIIYFNAETDLKFLK